MRVIIQRVSEASVCIHGSVHQAIGHGLLVFLGIEHADTTDDLQYLSQKISKLRIFRDEANQMNRSVKDVQGEVLVISQFTLHAQTRKGNRPSFINAARPEHAQRLYENFIERLRVDSSCVVKAGVFGADMQIRLLNDGPVTIMIDSKEI